MTEVGAEVGLSVEVLQTDGTAPVGRGIGPALEARDLLQVLQCDSGAPPDLRARSIALAAAVLEMGGRARRKISPLITATRHCHAAVRT